MPGAMASCASSHSSAMSCEDTFRCGFEIGALDDDLPAQARQQGHGAAVAPLLQFDARLAVLVEGLDGGDETHGRSLIKRAIVPHPAGADRRVAYCRAATAPRNRPPPIAACR